MRPNLTCEHNQPQHGDHQQQQHHADMQHHEINGQPAARLQFQRHRNRLVQVGTGHTLAGLLQSPRGADSPTDYIIHVGVGEWRAAVGFVAESEHMVGDRICAHGHVPIARLMRHVDDFFRTFHLRGHHVFGAVCHKRGNGIGLGIQRVEVEIGQAEQFRIDVERAAHNGLVSIMRSDQREILRSKESQRISWRIHHWAQQHLERHIRILPKQI